MTRALRVAITFTILLSTAHAKKAASSIDIEVDCTKTIRRLQVNPTGFCMSYLTDDDSPARKQPMAAAVKSMHLGSLRYPMGTLAENYLFHDLRLGQPKRGRLKPRVISKERNPAKWTYATNPDGSHTPAILDFDEFVRMYQASNTAPVVLVSSHGHLFPSSEFKEEDVMRNAEEWVRYANVTRKLGIKYWEIGNEVDLKHPREVMPPTEYMRIYKKMATRMKAVDPTIRTGLGTCNGAGYATQALKLFPNLVDFVVVHHYMGRLKTHDQYVKYNKPFLDKSMRTLRVIDKIAPKSRRKSTEILITEFSSFCAGATEVPADRKKNSILNAMITFEMLAEGAAMDDRVRFLHFWVTHSPWGKPNTTYANALGPDNTILPQGRALEIMGRFIQNRMVQIKCPKGPVRCWASASNDSTKLAIWLVNRTAHPKKTSIKLNQFTGPKSLSTWVMAGKNPNDEKPSWGAGPNVVLKNGRAVTTLPPLSITVLYTGE